MVKRRILHVVYSLDPGGMENGVVNVSNSLEEDLFEVSILCLSHRGELAKRLHSSIQVIELKKRQGLDLGIIAKIYRLFSELKPDVVHSHNLGPLIYVVLPLIASHNSIQLIHGEHASLTKTDLAKKKILQRLVLYTYCKMLHTVGREMTKHFNALYFVKSKVCTLQNGVDTQRFTPNLDKSNNKDVIHPKLKDKFVISLFARYGKYKGHAYVLDIFERIASIHPNTVLMFVGGGGEREQAILKMVDDHQYRDRIICTGFQQDPVPYYRASSIVILASENEGLSNVMLEAMSCSVPLVALNSCGVSDLIIDNQNGYILPSCSLDSAISLLSAVLCKPNYELAVIGKSGREFVERKYSIRTMIRNYEECYLEYSDSQWR